MSDNPSLHDIAPLNLNIKVLDHGFLRFIEDYGYGEIRVKEAGIIEAARQSTQGSFRGWDKDEKLLNFLFTNKHATPFEFAGLIIEVRAPIFVFREWHRHRTQSYNEMSARYSPLPDINYTPDEDRCMISSTANKQAGAVKGSDELTPLAANSWRTELDLFYTEAETLYQRGLNAGIPKELARLVLPVGRYSQMRVAANLRNWLAFLLLRMDPAAQWEIRQFANAVGLIIADRFPHTWAIFQEVTAK